MRDEYERELRYKRERDERIVSRRLSEAFKDPAVRARYNRCALVVQRVWRGHQIRYRLKEGVGGALVKSWEEQKRAEEEAEAARLAELERIAAGEEAPESIEGGAGGEAQAAGAGDEATAGGGGDGAEGEGGGEAAGAEGDSPDGGEAAPAAPAMEVAPTEVAAA